MSSRNKKHSDNISPDKGWCISLCRYSMETGLPSPSPSVTLPGLRLPASASLPLASCWPLPQQLLPVSATGGGRRRCWAFSAEIVFWICCSETPAGVSEQLFSQEGVVKADGSCNTPNIYHHSICNPAAGWFVYKADRHPATAGTE